MAESLINHALLPKFITSHDQSMSFRQVSRYFIYLHYTDEYKTRLNVNEPNYYKSKTYQNGKKRFVLEGFERSFHVTKPAILTFGPHLCT